jgi:hypothetical protein
MVFLRCFKLKKGKTHLEIDRLPYRKHQNEAIVLPQVNGLQRKKTVENRCGATLFTKNRFLVLQVTQNLKLGKELMSIQRASLIINGRTFIYFETKCTPN